MQPPYVIDVDPISLPQPVHKYDLFIQISLETDQPYNLEEVKTDSKPSQISVTIEPSNQLVTPHDHPTTFLSKIRMKMFNILRLPCHLNPYPLDCLEYLPQFSGENQVSDERHLKFFENFVNRFQIIVDL